jgi:hypothetical protein
VKRALLTRKERVRRAAARPIIAYDLETTRIAKGTPRPLFITAYGEAPALRLAQRVRSLESLRDILIDRFLIDDFKGVRFVAWNANHFDAYFVAAAMLLADGYVIRPYLTKGKNLRGLRIVRAEEQDERGQGWEFLDGIAMTGLQGVSLRKFLATFAPDHQKLAGPDFEREEFDPANGAHVRYALQDSIGLWHGITRAQAILLDRFNQPLTATIGNACIKIFTAHLPHGIELHGPNAELDAVIRDHVMRGGYCFCKGKYAGPVWKYDLNQAYAAAMRDAALPCGEPAWHAEGAPPMRVKVWVGRVFGVNPENRVPVYHKQRVGSRVLAVFSMDRLDNVWLTASEIEQLVSEGWFIHVAESWSWADAFNMREFVNELEAMRATCEGGPKGAIGTMIKAVGNHSYGKTVERPTAIELLLSREKPEGFAPYETPLEGIDLGHLWYRENEVIAKGHQQPQIGAFITAHVRMVIRRAALLDPAAWLYADTDCVVFSRDMTRRLDVDDFRYGAFKIEEKGTPYRIIAKKVYASEAGDVAHAKGLNVKKLKPDDFARWYAGDVPVQEQIQRQNFVKVMGGLDMFIERVRRGTRDEVGLA